MEKITLKRINITGSKVEYYYDSPVKFSKFLRSPENSLFVEYPSHYNISEVPQSVLMIPFVGNMLIASMILNIDIEVPTLDSTFFQSISAIKEAYKQMYPYLRLNFNVRAKKIIESKYIPSEKKITFFYRRIGCH
ncbi:hypothetical protein [Phocaeicola sp.]